MFSAGEIDPPEFGCEYILVLTTTKAKARTLAVNAWRLQKRLGYCDEGNENPFTGLLVEKLPSTDWVHDRTAQLQHLQDTPTVGLDDKI